MKEVLLVERVSQSKEIAYVVDTETGGITASYSRDCRKMNGALRKAEGYSTWRNARGLTGIKDAMSAKDIISLTGDDSTATSVISQRGIELLHDPDHKLSKRATTLATMLILKKLVARNYAVVTNDEIQELIQDRSGNYPRYLQELKSVNFCRVREISKVAKLITINPAYGYKGWAGEGGIIAALSGYYQRGPDFVNPHLYIRQNYEDGSLEAA